MPPEPRAQSEPLWSRWRRSLPWLGQPADHRRVVAACWGERLVTLAAALVEPAGLDERAVVALLAGRVPEAVDLTTPPPALEGGGEERLAATLGIATAAVRDLTEAAWWRWPFALLQGASHCPALAAAAASLMPPGERTARIHERQRALLGVDAAVPEPLTAWRRAGELDSPLPAGRMRQVAAREPRSLGSLLERFAAAGAVILLADAGEPRLAAVALRALAAASGGGEAPPLVADARGVPWEGSIEALVRRALLEETGYAPSSLRTLMLRRPDLARSREGPVDGPVLRRALVQWREAAGEGCLLVTLAPTAFTLRHASPGTVVLRPVDPPAEGGGAGPGQGGVRWTRSCWESRWRRVRECLGEDGEGASGPQDLALHGLFSDPALEAAGGLGRVLSSEVRRTVLPLRRQLQEALRRWVSRPGCLGREGGSLVPEARAGAQLYLFLHHLDPLAPARPRATFQGLALDRWLCFLAAAEYRFVATVLSALEDESLPGVHLVQVPPMEFANLRRADLSGGDLYHANLANADLRQARLRGIDLSRAHLKQADLRRADLRGADLSYACLEQADLRGTDLRGANLHRANLDDASTEGAITGGDLSAD